MPDINTTFSLPGYTITVSSTEMSSSTSVQEGIISSGSEFRLSWQTPGYGHKKFVGQLPENTFRYQKETTDYNNGRSYSRYNYPNGVWFNATEKTGIFGTPPIVHPFNMLVRLENQRNLVLAKLRKKMKDSDVDLSVMAGESKETWRMFTSLARTTIAAKAAAARGDISGLRKLLGIKEGTKASANVWLLLNYGIRPLINDFLGSVKAYEKGMLKERYLVVRAREKQIVEENVVTTFQTYGTQIEAWKLLHETSGRIKYQVTDAAVATLTSLGLTNPFSLGWELTKLSFVYDWLIGIGDWLSGWDASFGKTFVSASITQFYKIELSGSQSNDKWPGYQVYSWRSRYGYELVSCKRETFIDFPVQYLPGFNDKVGLFHVATATALLRQQRR